MSLTLLLLSSSFAAVLQVQESNKDVVFELQKLAFSSHNSSNESQDSDGDGITEPSDLCPGTRDGDAVDQQGCADSQVDADDDQLCYPGNRSGGPSGCQGLDPCPLSALQTCESAPHYIVGRESSQSVVDDLGEFSKNALSVLWDSLMGRNKKDTDGSRTDLRAVNYGTLHNLAFSPDGSLLAAGSQNDIDGQDLVVVWDISDLTIIQSLSFREPVAIPSVTVDKSTGQHTVFSPDGSMLAAASSKLVKVWNTSTWDEIQEFEAWRLVFSPDGQLAALGMDDEIEIRYTSNWSIYRSFDAETSEETAMTFSPDSTLFAWSSSSSSIYSSSDDGTVWVRRTSNWSELIGLEYDRGAVKSISFSPDGSLFVVENGDDISRTISIHDTSTWTLIDGFDYSHHSGRIGSENSIYSYAFSPDSTQLVIGTLSDDFGDECRISILNTSTLDLIESFDYKFCANSLAFSNDGSQIAASPMFWFPIGLENRVIVTLLMADSDWDGIPDSADGCVSLTINWTSTSGSDHDRDGCHDIREDEDDDNDGVLDSDDLCPRGLTGWTSTLSNDGDQDGCEDEDEDLDDDNNGMLDHRESEISGTTRVVAFVFMAFYLLLILILLLSRFGIIGLKPDVEQAQEDEQSHLSIEVDLGVGSEQTLSSKVTSDTDEQPNRTSDEDEEQSTEDSVEDIEEEEDGQDDGQESGRIDWLFRMIGSFFLSTLLSIIILVIWTIWFRNDDSLTSALILSAAVMIPVVTYLGMTLWVVRKAVKYVTKLPILLLFRPKQTISSLRERTSLPMMGRTEIILYLLMYMSLTFVQQMHILIGREPFQNDLIYYSLSGISILTANILLAFIIIGLVAFIVTAFGKLNWVVILAPFFVIYMVVVLQIYLTITSIPDHYLFFPWFSEMMSEIVVVRFVGWVVPFDISIFLDYKLPSVLRGVLMMAVPFLVFLMPVWEDIGHNLGLFKISADLVADGQGLGSSSSAAIGGVIDESDSSLGVTAEAAGIGGFIVKDGEAQQEPSAREP